MSASRKRLDQVMVERGLIITRARAQAAIRAGLVSIAGRAITKPAQLIDEDDEISLDASQGNYVSRAALKLIQGLNHFGVDPRGCTCLDLGASTGGFTQVLLERGASHITAIDVGHGQLADILAADERVTLIEGLNARNLTAAHLPRRVNLIVCDVSFIGLQKALPAALTLADEGAHLIALIKPQFEAGPENVGKGGIFRDASLHAKICDNIAAWLAAQPHWHVLGLTESPIKGGDGNKEFLIAARRAH
jgi:23S rRNA (cytidine1920-2'-O)/16S rRNA (cytidine1409-2'-O)-methyltransferase